MSAPKKAIPTLYQGIQFKSRLEADMAFLLDGLGLEGWEYETQSFLLPGGEHYWPDFWVPALHTWIECRGYTSDKGEAQIRGFAQWIREGRSDKEMQRPVQASQKVVAYLVARAIGSAVLYQHKREGAVSGLTFCQSCQRWFLSGDQKNCPFCLTSLGDSPLQVSIEGISGTLTITDVLGDCLAREWVGTWKNRQALAAEQAIIRCAGPGCYASAGTDDVLKVSEEWIVIYHRGIRCFCSQACLAGRLLRDMAYEAKEDSLAWALQRGELAVAEFRDAERYGRWDVPVDAAAAPEEETAVDSELTEILKTRWSEVVAFCREQSGKVGALLNHTEPEEVRIGETPTAILLVTYEFHWKKLREPLNLQMIETAVSEVLGQSARVKLYERWPYQQEQKAKAQQQGGEL